MFGILRHRGGRTRRPSCRGGRLGPLHLRLRRAHRTRPNYPAGRWDCPRLRARRCDV